MSFDGKNALVTGGSRGIGKAIALDLARRGVDVAFNYFRSDSAAIETQSAIEALGARSLRIRSNIADPSKLEGIFATVEKEFGRLDIMVNNAGGAMFIKQPEDLAPEEWGAAIAFNLGSVFLCSAAAGKVMIGQKGGKIINVSSVAGIRSSPAFVHYGAAKAGVINLTKSLAICWGPHNINVNCIAPGLTATEGVSDWLPPKTNKDGSPVPPLQFPPDPEHVAELAVFLASDASAHMSGELFPIRALTELA